LSKPRTGAPKRVAVGLLAGALAIFGVALAPPAGAAANVTNERLAGATRYGTAAAIAGDEAFTTVTTAIVATGETFPDALAASTLAGANAAAPIILTQTSTYTPETKAGLAALKTKGVSAVTIVGGTAAVAQNVEDAIKADGFTVTRIAGDDRYETAAAIATAANSKSAAANISGLKPGLFASGLNFPDALAGGPAAYANKIPLLLVNEGVPAETANAISTIGIKKAYILGGTAAVSSTVEAALVAATGNPATRLAGVNRFATAAAVGDFEATTLAFPMTSAILATGNQASGGADALASGPLGGQLKAPIVLTSSLPAESAAFLDKYSSTIQKLYVSGGTQAIDDATVAAAEAAAETVGNDSAGKAVTTRPELTGASIVGTTALNQVTPTQPAGTAVRYTFDEALGTAFAPIAGNFKVWNSSTSTAITGTTATIETGTGATGTTVLVNFSSLTTAASIADLSKATVAFEAVRDAGGAGNPEGEAPIGTAGSSGGAAGRTNAADLVSVGRFGTASTAGNTAVDFTFDQAAFVQGSASAFHLVDVNGVDTTCTAPTQADTTGGGGTIAGGNGTTTITVICPNVGGTSGPAFSASNVARGYVTANSIGTNAVGANPNPQEAADLAGSSLDPDLVSVSYSATTGVAIFTFDAPVVEATATQFYLYRTSGAMQTGTAASQAINSSNATQVSVTFTAGQTDYVGGGVTNGGTPSTSAVRTADFRYNDPDEEGFAGSATSLTPGRTAGPDLTSVVLSAIQDNFGNTTGYRADYTFDIAASTALTINNQNGFFLYLADGTRWESTACTTGTVGATTAPLAGQVRCSTYRNALSLAAPSTATTLQGAVLGTVASGAVSDSGSRINTEGAAATTGGNGTPAS
jgi:putative cell wall-binding protein